ncbi:UBX domain-containing protein 1 [Balamuthia mandrillaris]
MDEKSDILASFVSVTDADPAVASEFLEAHGWNLQQSIDSYLDGNASSTSSSSASALTDLIPEDTEDNVRAPIPGIRQHVLMDTPQFVQRVGPPSGFNGKAPQTVFEMFRDFRKEEELIQNMVDRGRKQAQKHGLRPDQTVTKEKIRTLADLFRPPVELLFNGGFEAAKEEAILQKKWLLVNVQEVKEFESQRLNRDTWSSPSLKGLIASKFIFWQPYKDSEDAQRFMTFYTVTLCPHIAILDPRTGQLMDSWEGFISAQELLSQLEDFVDNNSLEDDAPVAVLRNQRREATDSFVTSETKKKKAVVDLSEEEQLAAAIAASLEEDKKGEPEPERGRKRKTISMSEDENSDEADDYSDEEQVSEEDEEEPKSRNSEDEAESEKTTRNDTTKEKRHSETTRKEETSQHRPEKRLKTKAEKTPEDTKAASLSTKDNPTVPDFGEEGFAKDCILMVRLPDGSNLKGQFSSKATLRHVKIWLARKRKEQGITTSFDMMTPFPRKKFTEDTLDKTLQEHELVPRAVVILNETE